MKENNCNVEYIDVPSDDVKLPYSLYTKLYQNIIPYYHTNPQFEAHEILPGVYLGNILSSYDKIGLTNLNISHIISVIEGYEPPFPNDFNYLVVNSLDTKNTNISEIFNKTNDFLENVYENKKNVLIHCSYGISRSTTILCAFIIKKFGINVQRSLEMIKNKRSIVNPNSGFIEQLNQFYIQNKD